MNYALTLLAADTPITPAHLEKLEKFCEEHRLLISGDPHWLEPHRAARLPIDQLVTMEQMKQLRALFDASHMDVLCTPVRHKPCALLIADMDATMVAGETLDELAEEAGIGEKISAITAQAMNGTFNFEQALRERVSLLKDLPESALEKTLARITPTAGAEKFVAQFKEQGATCVLVSGGFTFFTGSIAQRLGFDHHHGNTLIIENGKLTGEVGTPILGKEAKLAYLKEYTQKLGCDLADTVAIGDGANDLPMLAAAGLGIGYRPKAILADNLLNCLYYADLDQVYF